MELGDLYIKKNTFTEKKFHWKIPRFSTLALDEIHEGPHFIFFNFGWCISIQPSDYTSNLTLYLEFDQYVGRFYEMKWTFGIVGADGSETGIKRSFHFSFQNRSNSEPFSLISREELLQRKTELVPQDNLTIMFHVKMKGDPMKLKERNTLSENILSLFISQEFCDINLQVKDKEFKAHKAIIAARSPVFAAMFKHETEEKPTGVVTIPDCDPDVFLEFLLFLYCGKVENISFLSAARLFKIAVKYDVNELSCFCIDYMRQEMKMENFFDVIALAEVYDHKRLHNAVQDFFNWNLKAIFKTAGWGNLMKTNLNLVNRLLIGMSHNDEMIRLRPRLGIEKFSNKKVYIKNSNKIF